MKRVGIKKRLDGLREVLTPAFRCELMGGRRLLIQGCRLILDYSEERICLAVRDGVIGEMVIGGEHLRCQSYHPDAIVIVGDIEKIELNKRE
jgi:sporulation protein YqfC